jgi:nicotinamidase/pyrazinamidase
MEIHQEKDCLLIIDLQNDFCSGGTLAVPGADDLVAPLNRIMKRFRYVITTQDWHPRNDPSFKTSGGCWPVHCVARTRGARFHPCLDTSRISFRIKKGMKGMNRNSNDYSGFEATLLTEKLTRLKIERLFLAGVATEYCVKATALDGLSAGFQVVVLKDLIRSIRATDGRCALSEIKRAGGQIIPGTAF